MHQYSNYESINIHLNFLHLLQYTVQSVDVDHCARILRDVEEDSCLYRISTSIEMPHFSQVLSIQTLTAFHMTE